MSIILASARSILPLAIIALAAVATYKVIYFVYHWSTSPLRQLRGPPIKVSLLGHFPEIRAADPILRKDGWLERYGKVMRCQGFLGMNALLLLDMRAVQHVLSRGMDYEKPELTRKGLERICGPGLLVTEGEKHRTQRRIMNPSFGPSAVKSYTPIFFKKALELRDIWRKEISSDPKSSHVLEALSWLSRLTLDVIGLTGFNYQFEALTNSEPNELNKAFATLLNPDGKAFSFYRAIRNSIPIVRSLPSKRGKEEKVAQETMVGIARQLLHANKQEGIEQLEKGLKTRDLFSALVRANVDEDLPPSQRMTEEDVVAQVPTFLATGHETISTEATWCLFALAGHPDTQARLRRELQAVPTDTPSADELMKLTFLDDVVRETLRLHPAVPNSVKIALHDDVIPVREPYVDATGVTRNEIHIRKGELIYIPLLAINRVKFIWGDDADEFNPDRWRSQPDATKSIPGVWGNLMTFLGGSHSCIGYQFALYEMKAILFTLLRTFEFELEYPADAFEKKWMIVQRPYLKSQKNSNAQMPLRVKLCSQPTPSST